MSTLPPPVAASPSSQRMHPLSLLRRVAGAALVALAVLPLFRLLPGRETGIAGEGTVTILEVYFEVLLSGALLMLLPVLVAGRFVASESMDRLFAAARARLLAPRLPVFALGIAAVSVAATAAFTLLVFEGKPSLIDAMAQLLHARFWAAGQLAGPASALNEFWHIQNSLITERGWISQYPPGHVALLALGFRLGAVWLVGPLLAGVTVFFTTLAAVRLLPERPATARLAGVLLALSTYFICLSGSFLNHVTSAALFSLALYCAVRARDGRPAWAAGAGAALGFAFAVRPLSAIVVGLTFAFLLWLPSLSRASLGAFARRAAFAVAGGLPFLAAFLAYNTHFFGHPLRLGYRVALGPAMSLGFHRDPWGNVYGPVEALAYTGSDLLTLGINLLETPLSATLLIGVWLLIATPLSRGARVFLGWALVTIGANALYWHHGIYMGPRMLLESAPAWAALTALAASALFERAPAGRTLLAGRFSARSAVGGGLVFALLVGVLYMGPQRARSYGGGWIPIARIEPPRPDGPALVFVHDAWKSRVAMRLAVAGMSLDSVETAIRQNSTCDVHDVALRIASSSERSRAAMATLDMAPRATGLPEEVMIAPGNRIRVASGETLVGDCLREARAGTHGILDIAPFAWQGDLPDSAGDGPLYVRDYGPEGNIAAMRRWPDRTPWVFMVPAVGADPVLLDYATGMQRLWGVGAGS